MKQSASTARLDPREVPAYGLAEAAYYLGIPTATLRSWVLGRDYSVADGTRRFAPIIEIADRKRKLLSFINLVEAHILSALRREHAIHYHKFARPSLTCAASFNPGTRSPINSSRPMVLIFSSRNTVNSSTSHATASWPCVMSCNPS